MLVHSGQMKMWLTSGKTMGANGCLLTRSKEGTPLNTLQVTAAQFLQCEPLLTVVEELMTMFFFSVIFNIS